MYKNMVLIAINHHMACLKAAIYQIYSKKTQLECENYKLREVKGKKVMKD